MIIIGEKINSTRTVIQEAIENQNSNLIIEVAKDQEEAQASYIDLNAGTFTETEEEKLSWLVKVVQKKVDLPLCIDSPNPKALRKALEVYENKSEKPLLNSISNETARWNEISPVLSDFKCKVIALVMDDTGMPETANDSFKIAKTLIEKLAALGIRQDDIFIDPLVRPVATGSQYGKVALESIYRIREAFPEVHITCGLSNISFGLPARQLMNAAFLVSAITAGLDSAILNPLDQKLMALLYAAEALIGKDDYCIEYITQYREGVFDTFANILHS